jgi:hypothetical protein
MTERPEGVLEMFLEKKSRMVRADRDSHGEGLYYDGLASDRHDLRAR